jgi:hypothetical protein
MFDSGRREVRATGCARISSLCTNERFSGSTYHTFGEVASTYVDDQLRLA